MPLNGERDDARALRLPTNEAGDVSFTIDASSNMLR